MRVSGSAISNYGGTTITGIPRAPQACPSALPRAPRLAVTAHLARSGATRLLRLRVTATIRGAGANERGLDTRAVEGALIRLGGALARTDTRGQAILTVPARSTGRAKISVTAGDTLSRAIVFVDVKRQ